jgi:hypothetical protein
VEPLGLAVALQLVMMVQVLVVQVSEQAKTVMSVATVFQVVAVQVESLLVAMVALA